MELNILKNALNAVGQTYSLVGVADEQIWLEFDTIDECATSGSATVTKYPTEYGTYATEYKYRNPDTVRMTGIISSGGATGYTSILRRMGSWDRQSAIESIRGNLKKLVAQMTLLNIQTRNAGRRDNMTLTAYEINETYDNSGSMEVTMQFQEIPQFGNDPKAKQNVSDDDTQESGISLTQVVAVAGAGLLIAGSAIRGNIAAFS